MSIGYLERLYSVRSQFESEKHGQAGSTLKKAIDLTKEFAVDDLPAVLPAASADAVIKRIDSFCSAAVMALFGPSLSFVS